MSVDADAMRAARPLAEEFGTTVETMAAFLCRFAPRWTVAGQHGAGSDVMLFVHVPKTAGISLGTSLRGAFDEFLPVQWGDVPNSFRSQMRQALYRQTQGPLRQVIMGHFGWPELQIWRNHDLPLKCGTLLRDPLARMVSNFHYNRSEVHPKHAEFRARFASLTDYARALPTDVQLVQAIGMFDSFDTALRKCVAHYSFLGVTERMADALAHLSRSHDLPAMVEKKANVAKRPVREPIPPEVAHLVAERSHNDAKMHRLLLRIYDGA